MVTTARDLQTKNPGDSITELAGVIEHRKLAKAGTNDNGAWTLQGFVLLDASNEKISVNIWDRQPIPADATSIYISAVMGGKNKDKLVGAILELDKDGNRRVKASSSADVMVSVGGQPWVKIPAIAKEAVKQPAPPPTQPMPQPAPAATPPSQPPINHDPKPPAAPLTPNEQVDKLPASQLIITKSACVKSAADVVASLIAAGKFDPDQPAIEGDQRDQNKRISDKVDDLAGWMFNSCRDVEIHIPF